MCVWTLSIVLFIILKNVSETGICLHQVKTYSVGPKSIKLNSVGFHLRMETDSCFETLFLDVQNILYKKHFTEIWKLYRIRKVRSSGCNAIYFGEIRTFRRNLSASSLGSYIPRASASFLFGLSFDIEYGGYILLRNVGFSPSCRYYNREDRIPYTERRCSLKPNKYSLSLLKKYAHYIREAGYEVWTRAMKRTAPEYVSVWRIVRSSVKIT